MTPFVTNPEFLVRYDWRWIGKNVLDDGTAATFANLSNPASTSGGTVLAAFLAEASEDVLGACAVAARYTESDLRTYGGSLLIRIVCDLTMGKVLKRRGRALTDEDALSKPYTEALSYLEQLRRGERIFYAVPNVPEAGLPGTADMQPLTVNGIPVQTTSAGGIVFGVAPWVQGASRYFGYGGMNRGQTWGN